MIQRLGIELSPKLLKCSSLDTDSCFPPTPEEMPQIETRVVLIQEAAKCEELLKALEVSPIL